MAVVVAVVSSLLAVQAAAGAQSGAGGFGDVSADTYYSLPVSALAGRGVFAGTLCGAGFCPSAPIDRKTMAVWAVRAVDGRDPDPIAVSRFNDVSADSFYGPFIERLAVLGITVGCGDRSGFCPDREMTRAETAIMLARQFKLPDSPSPNFSDVPADAYYAPFVARIAAAGVTVGCGDGTRFCPSSKVTRAQMATFLYRGAEPVRPTLRTLKWHSAGDSYSSGTGAEPYYDESHGCRRSREAYGHVAAGELAADEWLIGSHTGAAAITSNAIAFSACHGHHVEEFFFDHSHNGEPHSQLWPAGSEPVDVLTMSMGGNDVGFDAILGEFADCQKQAWRVILGDVPEECREFLPLTEEHVVLALGLRMSRLLRPVKVCTGLRYNDDLPDKYECDLKIPGGRGGLDDFYYQVATGALTNDGVLYVVLYPQPIANVEDWETRVGIPQCSVVSPLIVKTVASIAAQLTKKLNDTIIEAIGIANRRLGETRIRYLDTHALYRSGAHELCGTGERWMHGVTLRGSKAFHPNAAGHKATGEALADLIGATHPYAAEAATIEQRLDEYRADVRQRDRYLDELRTVLFRLVTLAPGDSAKGWEDCSTDPCKHLRITLHEFTPGAYSVECWSSLSSSRWYPPEGKTRTWTWPTSRLWQEGGCWFGYPGERVWVVVDGIKSNEVIWPR